MARIVAPRLELRTGHRVTVENKPNDKAEPAGEFLKKGLVQGSVVAFLPTTTIAMAPPGDIFPFDSKSDLVPLTMAGVFQVAIAAAPSTGLATFANYVAWLRAGPPERWRLGTTATDAYASCHALVPLLPIRVYVRKRKPFSNDEALQFAHECWAYRYPRRAYSRSAVPGRLGQETAQDRSPLLRARSLEVLQIAPGTTYDSRWKGSGLSGSVMSALGQTETSGQMHSTSVPSSEADIERRDSYCRGQRSSWSRKRYRRVEFRTATTFSQELVRGLTSVGQWQPSANRWGSGLSH
jgi:hypothetical protein